MEKFPEQNLRKELDKTDEEVFREYMNDLDLVPEDFDGKILDVGAGGAEFARWAKDNNVSSEIYSIEPSDEIKDSPKGVKARAGELPFHDNEFDLIVSNAAVPNVFIGGSKETVKKQIKDSLTEFLRVSKTDGEIRLGRVQKGTLYENQRNFSEAFDEALSELAKKHNLSINEIHTKPDTYEYDSNGNPTRLLAESFLVEIRKSA